MARKRGTGTRRRLEIMSNFPPESLARYETCSTLQTDITSGRRLRYDYLMSLSQKMREARRENHLSQKALGDALGISQVMVAEIESGVRLLPKELEPFVSKFIQTGNLPSGRDLAGRKNSREGK